MNDRLRKRSLCLKRNRQNKNNIGIKSDMDQIVENDSEINKLKFLLKIG